MKKSMKALFVLMVLSLFTIIGINTVKADASVTNINIVCEPRSIEIGQESTCYIIGKVTNDPSTGAGVHGLLTKVTTSHLDIVSFKAGNGKDNTSAYTAEKHSNGQQYSSATPASGVTCSTQGEDCYGFFTIGTNTPGQFKNTAAGTNIGSIDSQYTGYTAFGYFKVKLDDTATATECGEICMLADYAATAADYGRNVHINTEEVCEEITPQMTPSVEKEPEKPVETGSFVSIAVLVAGALIAIGAIAIAKKNNKIYKV